VRFVQSALNVFGAEIEWHRRSHCDARPAGLPAPGVPARPSPGRAPRRVERTVRRSR
jgi:hypothetical protein